MLSHFLRACTSKKSFSFLGSQGFTTNLTSQTVSSANLGAEASDRRIIVVCGCSTGSLGTPTVTVGGVSATINVSAISNNVILIIATALVPTGTTGDIVVNPNGTAKSGWGIGWYRATGLASNNATATNTATTGSLGASSNIGGFAVAVAGNSNSGRNFAWTGATENFEYTTNRTNGGASVSTTSTTTNISVSNTQHAAMATF